MTRGWRGHDAILTDQELFHAVSGADLGDELGDFGVPVAAVAADNEEGVLDAFGDGEEDRGDEVFGVVGLLEDFDFFAKAGAVGGGLLACW